MGTAARSRLTPGALLLLAALLTLPAVQPAAAQPPDELPRLLAGETLVRVDGLEGVARRVLDAPPERLFRAAADWAHYHEFFPFVKLSRAAVDTAGAVTGHQVIDLPFPWADRRFRATVEHGGGEQRAGDGLLRVAWRAVPGSGNVTENRGEWRFTEIAPGRTLVELRLVSDAGPGVPRGFQRRALEDTLPYALDGLRQHAGRCRYDVPRHPTCPEAPPVPDLAAPAFPTGATP